MEHNEQARRYEVAQKRALCLRLELGYTMSSAMRAKLTEELREVSAEIGELTRSLDIRKVNLA